ncbi:sodium channel protein Nach [Musca vetustissima]|uniref:sodium channel protein Nach n=1 Tax=Musca vetustissima TaxID=27455 RepID=UPI002AB6972E|nr:sodium channel protein Nach [Musca vetustissima]
MAIKTKPIFAIKNVVPYNSSFDHYMKSSFSTTATSMAYLEKSAKANKPKNKTQTVKSWFMENFRNFCNTTSLHGFNYITRMDLSPNERFFWLIVTIIAIIVSISLVIVSYVWNGETPTVTVIESSHYPTWNIPFPAVTLCNFNKISKTKVENMASALKRPPNTTEEDVMKMFNIVMYYSFAFNETDANMTFAKQVLTLNNMTISDLSRTLTPNCMDMISRCIWKGTNTRCDGLFQRIKSMGLGECCTFNYFGETKHNFPEKIAYLVPKRPYRVTGCGYPTGLSILINPFAFDYSASSFSSYGFRLLIHDSYTVPDENAETKIISSARESFLHINPESTYATSDIYKLDVKDRNCLFPHERKLSVMQRYSFTNCMWECRVNLILKKCGCIPHTLANNGSYPVCDVDDVLCVLKYRVVFTRALNDNNATLSAVRNTAKFPCNCLPDCQSNNYVSEITMGRLNVRLLFQNEDVERPPDDTNNILLHIFFSDLMSTRYRKEVYQNWLSALASFGGLLGLIMGFSIVTAFEFIYFLTFRPIFNYYNHL